MKNNIKTVFVMVGTIVGAGFVSGKEIYSFFFIYGKTGLIGICLSCILMGIVIYEVLEICIRNKIHSFKEFCETIENKIIKRKDNKNTISKLFNIIINTFLLLMFYVMISGFSSFIYQEFYIPRIVGGLIIITLCYMTFIGNMKKIVKLSNLLIPILIFFIVYISIITISRNGLQYSMKMQYFERFNINRGLSIINAILYASYNCIALIPVVIQLYITTKENKINPKIISITNIIILIILSFSIFSLLLQADIETYNLDMPIIAIANQLGKKYSVIYSLVIGIAIYTSAISSGVRIFK